MQTHEPVQRASTENRNGEGSSQATAKFAPVTLTYADMMPFGPSFPSPPTGRHDFEIAIMCALSLEAEAVAALFDKHWDSKPYGKAAGDTNTYSFGAIGRHNVVLVHMPNMGKVAAATAAAFLRASFERIRLALVVGICGGVPFGKASNDENSSGRHCDQRRHYPI